MPIETPGPVMVNVDNFVRVETNRNFSVSLGTTGGVNVWDHARQPIPVERQPIIRPNRDTLCSVAVVDISEGCTFTMPDADGRYMTAMVINQDHYTNRVFDRPGRYEVTIAEFDTPYVALGVRTLVDAS